jgi:hypothetical protein
MRDDIVAKPGLCENVMRAIYALQFPAVMFKAFDDIAAVGEHLVFLDSFRAITNNVSCFGPSTAFS